MNGRRHAGAVETPFPRETGVADRRVPIIVLGCITLIWGYLWIPGKLGVTNSSPFLWAGMRTFPAYVLLLGLLLVLRRPIRPRALGLTALVGLLQVGGFVGFSSAALATKGAGHTGMLANTWQFWILVLAWPLLGERLRRRQWLAVGVGLAGLVLIIEPWRVHGVVSSIFALVAALCFAAGAVVAKILRRRHQVDVLSLTTWQGLFGSLPLVVLAAVFPGDGIPWTTLSARPLGATRGAAEWSRDHGHGADGGGPRPARRPAFQNPRVSPTSTMRIRPFVIDRDVTTSWL